MKRRRAWVGYQRPQWSAATAGLCVVAVVVLAVGAWVVVDWRRGGTEELPWVAAGTANWASPGITLDDYVKSAEIIVVGEVVAVEGTEEIYPDGYKPGELPPGISPAVLFTDFVLEVSEYVEGDGPETITYRQPGDLVNTNGSPQFPRPPFDTPMLLFLGRGAGRDTWSTGPTGRVTEEAGSW